MKVTMAGARVSAGYTQQELADKIGVSRATVNAWENGKVPMKMAYFIAFCNVTGFDAGDIIMPLKSTESRQEVTA